MLDIVSLKVLAMWLNYLPLLLGPLRHLSVTSKSSSGVQMGKERPVSRGPKGTITLACLESFVVNQSP